MKDSPNTYKKKLFTEISFLKYIGARKRLIFPASIIHMTMHRHSISFIINNLNSK